MDEVRGLLARGVPPEARPFGGLVYRQVMEMLDGVRGEEETRRLIVQAAEVETTSRPAVTTPPVTEADPSVPIRFFRLVKNLTADGYYTSRAGLLEELGYTGNTGNARGGPAHLHYAIYRHGSAQNPYPRLVMTNAPVESRAVASTPASDPPRQRFEHGRRGQRRCLDAGAVRRWSLRRFLQLGINSGRWRHEWRL